MDEEYDDYQARELYIKETRANLESNLRDLELWDDTIDGTMSDIPKLGGYIVSSNSLRKLVASFRSHSDLELAAEQIEGCIDEAELLHDLLATAYRRRYSSEQAPGKH